MNLIKTIAETKATNFDAAVNAAIEEGWHLTKRLIMPTPHGICLYAELEREVITPAEQCCENCKHYDSDVDEEPCRSCSDLADKWEGANA
jgi:hypothetical protein